MKYLKHILLIVVIGAVVWHFFFKTQTVMVGKVVTGDAVETVYATGTVETTSMVPIRSKVSGRLMEIVAQEGQQVKKGEKLAELDDLEIKAKNTELKALVDFYKVELDRAEKLLKEGAGSVQNRDKAKSTFLNAEAVLLGNEINLKEYTILSPADCTVIQQDGEIGEMIGLDYELFWLDCSGKYRITAEVDEEDINYVKIGQKALLKYEGDIDKVYEGTVASVTPRGDAESRVFRVRIAVGQDLPFMLGMSTEVNIITGIEEDKTLVPSKAVVDNSIVWGVEKGKLVKYDVVIGTVGDDKTEIKSGLNPGAVIVTTPLPWFSEGKTVETMVDKTGRKRR